MAILSSILHTGPHRRTRVKCCVAWIASLLQRGPTLHSVGTRPAVLAFRDRSLRAKNPLIFLSHVFFLVWLWGLPRLPSPSSKLSCLCGQNIETVETLLPRSEHIWEEDAEMEGEMKAGSEGFSRSMPIWLVWADQQDCLWVIIHLKDGISLCPPLNLPVPKGQINSGSQTQEDTPQDSFCAG